MDVHHPSFTRPAISTARPHAQPLNSKLINCLMGLTIGALVAPTYLLSAANPAMAQFTPSTQSEQSRQAPAFAATTIPDPIADATAAPTSVQSLLGTEFPLAEEVLQFASAPSQLTVRSIWLDRETIVNAGSPQGLARVFDRFKSAGINTVFVETVNAGYPIYPSDVAPEQNPNIQGWDPLQAAVDLGKANGIEVHAWVWLFAAGNQAHNRLLGQPSHYPGPILSARPDWAGFDNHGNLIIPGQNKPFLDPANPEVRQYLLDMLGEIATQYDVDGIQLDYVRYPFQDPSANRLFGYGNAAREQFHRLTGVDPITLSPRNNGDPRMARLWSQWTDFRAQQVSTFVAAASRQLRRQRPDLTLSAAVFAEDTYKRRHELQQDWEDWADQGIVDWIVLMSYASNTREFEDLIRPWVIESSFRHTQVIPGIRLLGLPTSEAYSQIQLLQNMPVNGYALFAADNLNNEVQSMLAGVRSSEQRTAFHR
ncbi:MAG: family 10 glycosylhydrolase [Cyanobacteria bacterium J06627_28]